MILIGLNSTQRLIDLGCKKYCFIFVDNLSVGKLRQKVIESIKDNNISNQKYCSSNEILKKNLEFDAKI
jgi:hypothetical protein